MKNLLAVLAKANDKKYTVTDKGRLQQKEQLELKTEITNGIFLDLEESGIEVIHVPKGFVILVPNEDEGAIPLELSVTTKPLDYDYDLQHEEWQAKQDKLAEKAAAKKE